MGIGAITPGTYRSTVEDRCRRMCSRVMGLQLTIVRGLVVMEKRESGVQQMVEWIKRREERRQKRAVQAWKRGGRWAGAENRQREWRASGRRALKRSPPAPEPASQPAESQRTNPWRSVHPSRAVRAQAGRDGRLGWMLAPGCECRRKAALCAAGAGAKAPLGCWTNECWWWVTVSSAAGL